GALAVFALASSSARGDVTAPHGVQVVRVLGARAEQTLAPKSGQIGALVALPNGVRAEDLGLEPVTPGVARLRGPASTIRAFGDAHPTVHVEVAPPLHPLLDKAGDWIKSDVARFRYGVDGTGVLIGVADTGLDVSHPDLLDENGKSRVAWMLDLS